MNTRQHIVSAIVQWDNQQSKRKGYNPYALAIALRPLDDIISGVESGKDLRQLIVQAYNGRLLDRILKSVGLPISTDTEQRGF